jgi:hypothetical protein
VLKIFIAEYFLLQVKLRHPIDVAWLQKLLSALIARRPLSAAKGDGILAARIMTRKKCGYARSASVSSEQVPMVASWRVRTIIY